MRIGNAAGLKLIGLPNNIERFYIVLGAEGCHPKAAHRILNRIYKNGYDELTITSLVNIEWVQSELSKIGMEVKFITPLTDWKPKYDDGKWPDWALPEKLRKNYGKERD